MDWISVKDRLPEIPKGRYSLTVLVAQFDSTFHELSGNGYSVGEMQFDLDGEFKELCLAHNDWVWYSAFDPVTHWMPLPEPPSPSLS